MHGLRPFGYALIALAATACVVACAGRGAGPVPATPTEQLERGVARLPARDLGRRDPSARVQTAIALRFRNAAELDRLAAEVADPRSAHYHRFLRPSEFATRFSPTAAQQQRVLEALRSAGFTIDRTFANRALIDASAPSGVAERFFGTRIHDFDQGTHGTRYAAVARVRVPPALAGLVASVELSSFVYARPEGGVQDGPTPDARTNAVVNGGFEQKLKDWQSCGKSGPYITGKHPYQGQFDALTGSRTTTSGDVTGWSAICQRVTIPANAMLTVALYDATNAKNAEKSFQAVGLMNKPGSVVAIFRKTLLDNGRWVKKTFDLSKYAGRTTYLFFGVRGSGQKQFYDMQYVDAVSLTGAVPTTPTPSPTPSGSPKPSSTPSATPSPTPSPSPTPTSAGPLGPGTDNPLTGPTQGPQNGWAPRGVADGFDFPVQHGYAGVGVHVGIIADQRAFGDDLRNFWSYNLIAPAPSMTYEPIGVPTTLSNDPTEATLDIEAVTGLAPGARLIVYLTNDFSNESILNAYNLALNDDNVAVLESPFAECESEDPNFTSESDQLATAGAALGITFVAAAGDEGSACYDAASGTNVIGVSAPASGPHFLAVGGNQSLASGSVANPAVWNDRTSGIGVGMGGGGVSASWTLPSYQQDLGGNPSSTTQRNVPDIALPAVNDDVFLNDSDELVEGTSWSSSIATALLTTSVEFCGPLGWVNPAVYAEYAKSGETRTFIDVTTGKNFPFAGNLTTGYTAQPGYDNASGIGMPNGIKFGASLCGRNTSLVQRR